MFSQLICPSCSSINRCEQSFFNYHWKMQCARKAQSWAPGKGRKKGANCWWEGAKGMACKLVFILCVVVLWHKLAPNCPSPLLVHRHTLPFRPVFSSVLGTEELCSYFVLSVDLQPSIDGIFACLLLLMLIVVVVPRHQLRTHSFFIESLIDLRFCCSTAISGTQNVECVIVWLLDFCWFHLALFSLN